MLGLPVSEFIKHHNHINYCEAIILKNGNIVYATPSHIKKMIELTCFSESYISTIMPVDASPVDWLVSEFDFVPVWYNFFMYHSLTKYQKRTLQLLVKSGVLMNGITGTYTDEKQWIDILDLYRTGAIQELPKRIKECACITNSGIKVSNISS